MVAKFNKFSAGCFFAVALIFLPVMYPNAQEFKVIPEPDSADLKGLNGKADSAKRIYTKDEISKAYMNCLIDVDNTLALLAKKAEAKVVQYESVSQRGFCENRRKDCNRDSLSADCQTFMEEFVNAKVL
jgi:hypothetical protein